MIYEVEVKFNGDTLTVEDNRITVSLNSKPHKGEANKELIRKIAKLFKTSTFNVKIIKGLKSRHKIVEVKDE